MKNVTLTQLRYIISLDTYRSFSEAAYQCFVTQPTLSMQVQKFEDDVGAILFDRSKNPVIPTKIGEIVISQSKKILRELDTLNSLIGESKDTISGELKVGIIPTLSSGLVPLFLNDFVKAFPKLTLIMEEFQTSEIISRLRDDLLDVGIAATPLKESSIHEKVLFYEPFVVYVYNDHPLFSKKKVRVQDVIKERILLLNEGHCFQNQILNMCTSSRTPDIKENQSFLFRSGSFQTLQRLVEKGIGITLLPYLHIMGISTDEKKLVREFYGKAPSREISLIYSRSDLKKSFLSSLASKILENIPKQLLLKKSLEVIKI